MNIAELISPAPVYFFTTLVIYLIILGGIGYYAAKKTTSLKEFFILGGKAGAIVSGFAYFATQYSMSTFMGVPSVTYGTGYAGMTISVPAVAFGMIIPALFVGRRLMVLARRNNLLTMTDFLGDRYDSKHVRSFHAVLMVIFLIAIIGAQTVGAGIIVRTFTGLPEWVGVLGMGVIVVLYCMSGGMKGAMLTDVLQGGLMLLTAIVAFVLTIKAGGGLSQINRDLLALDSSYLSHPGKLKNYPYNTYISMVVMWSFFTIGQPTLFTKFYAMKNFKVLFRAVLLGTLGMVLSVVLIEWVGVNAIVTLPSVLEGKERDFIVPLILQQSLSPMFAALLSAGILSAGMSTIDALLVTATGGITRDIYQNFINPEASDQKILRLSRYITILIGIAGVIVGIAKPAGIFAIVRFSFGGLGLWVAPVILGLYWKRATGQATIVSIVIGEILYIVMKLGMIPSFGFDPLIPSWVITMVLMVIFSHLTKATNEETLKRYFPKKVGE